MIGGNGSWTCSPSSSSALAVATLFLGLLAMAGGGETDREASTPLMWTRVGFQGLTLLLLVIAVLLR